MIEISNFRIIEQSRWGKTAAARRLSAPYREIPEKTSKKSYRGTKKQLDKTAARNYHIHN